MSKRDSEQLGLLHSAKRQAVELLNPSEVLLIVLPYIKRAREVCKDWRDRLEADLITVFRKKRDFYIAVGLQPSYENRMLTNFMPTHRALSIGIAMALALHGRGVDLHEDVVEGTMARLCDKKSDQLSLLREMYAGLTAGGTVTSQWEAVLPWTYMHPVKPSCKPMRLADLLRALDQLPLPPSLQLRILRNAWHSLAFVGWKPLLGQHLMCAGVPFSVIDALVVEVGPDLFQLDPESIAAKIYFSEGRYTGFFTTKFDSDYLDEGCRRWPDFVKTICNTQFFAQHIDWPTAATLLRKTLVPDQQISVLVAASQQAGRPEEREKMEQHFGRELELVPVSNEAVDAACKRVPGACLLRFLMKVSTFDVRYEWLCRLAPHSNMVKFHPKWHYVILEYESEKERLITRYLFSRTGWMEFVCEFQGMYGYCPEVMTNMFWPSLRARFLSLGGPADSTLYSGAFKRIVLLQDVPDDS